ncbi:insecticidal delta-endotoxin Cry8Ea1 family protein (plasmid) [Bacillus sp. A01H]
MTRIEDLYPRSDAEFQAARLETEAATSESLLQNLKTGIEQGTYQQAIDTIFQNISSGTIDYVSFVDSTLRLAPMSTPETGLFSPLVGLYFSGLNQIPATRDVQSNVFQALNPLIADALGRALTTDELDHMNAEVSGIRATLIPYQTYMDQIQNVYGGFQHITSQMRQEFMSAVNNVDTILADRLPSLLYTDPAQAMIGLPYFCGFAAMHLQLYKDMIIHGSTWDPEHYNAEVIGAKKAVLQKYIQLYAQEAYAGFTQGLALLGGDDLKPSNTATFSQQKQYIQFLTINALDKARLFPTFDPDLYPYGLTTNIPTNHQFVSSILPGYCMPSSFPSDFDFPISDNGTIRKDPELAAIESDTSTDKTYGSPVFLQIQDRNGTVRKWGKESGDQYSLPFINPVDPLIGFGAAAAVSFDSNGHPKYDLCSSDSIFGFQFLTDYKQLTTWSRIDLPADFMPWLRAPSGYKIRTLYPLYDSSKPATPFGGYVTVFDPLDSPAFGLLAPDASGNLSVIGIPLESFGEQQGWVVPEWTTGSNVVQLPPGQTITVPIFNVLEGQYTMRVNYACNANVDMVVNIETGTGHSVFSNTVSFSATNSNDFPGKNGYYRNQLITDTLDMGTFSMTIDHIQLTNKGTSDIFLDRVEFIPAASDTAQTGTFIAKEVTISNNQQPITIYDGETIYNTIQLVSSLNNITFQFYKKGFLVDTSIPTANTSLSKQVPTGFDRIEVTTSNPNETVVDILARLTLDSTLPITRQKITLPTDTSPITIDIDPMRMYNTANLLYVRENESDSFEVECLFYQGGIQTDSVTLAAGSSITKQVPARFDRIDLRATSLSGTHRIELDGELSFDSSLVPVYSVDQTVDISDTSWIYITGNGPGNGNFVEFVITSPYSIEIALWKNDIRIKDDFTANNVANMSIKNVEFDAITIRNPFDGILTSVTITGTYGTSSSKSLTEPTNLNQITQQVQDLFATQDQTAVSHEINDYWIDQVVLKVDALSDEVFGKEKKALRKLVNKAKQLSKARNLLIGGSFDTLDAWQLGKNVVRREGGELFKGEHLLLPPPTTLSPSYAYQKIDEAKLKPYTRYTVSGFVAQGDPLEVVVSRYGKEIEKTLHVPYEEAHPITSEPTPNCCQPGTPSSCNGETPDSHFFHYNIDVGALQTEANLGISLGLRIGETVANTLGLARIGNLEIREERPLTASEIRKVQKVETKWKKEWEQERADVTAKLQPVIDQINALYVNNDWNGLVRPHIVEADIHAITIPDLPKQRHWFMTDREGEHRSITEQMQQALTRAMNLLESQNLIHNGSFTNGLMNWTVEGGATVQLVSGENKALFLPHWDSSAAQNVQITNFDEDTEYTLRVRGKGKGKITLQHGTTGEQVETMVFSQKNMQKQELSYLTFETAEIEIEITSEDGGLTIDSIELIEMTEM